MHQVNSVLIFNYFTVQYLEKAKSRKAGKVNWFLKSFPRIPLNVEHHIKCSNMMINIVVYQSSVIIGESGIAG